MYKSVDQLFGGSAKARTRTIPTLEETSATCFKDTVMHTLYQAKHHFGAILFLSALHVLLFLSVVTADFPETRRSRSQPDGHRGEGRRHRPGRLMGRRGSPRGMGGSSSDSGLHPRRHQQSDLLSSFYNERVGEATRNSDARSQGSPASRRRHGQVVHSPRDDTEAHTRQRASEPGRSPSPGVRLIQPNCSVCLTREYARHRRVESMKLSILEKLGMKSPPNITRKTLPNIPPLAQYIRNMGMTNDEPSRASARREEEYEDEDYHSVIERIIILSQTAPEDLGLPSTGVSYFTFQPDLGPSRIHKAHFSLYVKAPREGSPRTTWIKIYKFRKHNNHLNQILVKTRKLHLDQKKSGYWITFDFTKLVQNWVKSPRTNYGLYIAPVNGRSLAVVDPENEREEALIPFLDISLKNKKSRRMRRTPAWICDMQLQEERCCRYPLDIDFVEFEWDWIISPKRFRANFCSGECPYLFQPSFIHSVVLSQKFPDGVKGPCCSPRKLNPISLIYYDENMNIKLGHLAGMIVEKCGCS